jgi:hypothetical protein
MVQKDDSPQVRANSSCAGSSRPGGRVNNLYPILVLKREKE